LLLTPKITHRSGSRRAASSATTIIAEASLPSSTARTRLATDEPGLSCRWSSPGGASSRGLS